MGGADDKIFSILQVIAQLGIIRSELKSFFKYLWREIVLLVDENRYLSNLHRSIV